MPRERFGFETYVSPLTWRYGSEEMKDLFSEIEKRATWRKVWRSLASAEASFGIVSEREARAIASKSGRKHIDLGRSHQVEAGTKHDLVAELRVYSEQVGKAGGKLHIGATSADIEDNADILIFRRALQIIQERLVSCLGALARIIERHRGLACMAWTHLQAAEPTTLGYRFCTYAQDLIMDLEFVRALLDNYVKGKGLGGAVGTSASFVQLLHSETKAIDLEKKMMKDLQLDHFPVTGQTYPRKVDFMILNCLSSIAQSCHKLAFDFRLLQSPGIGEISEKLTRTQVGSSAMPFKRNPINSERICSLARFISVLPNVGFMNGAFSLLERTLDDSASRRIVLPEAFIATDECLSIYKVLVKNLEVYPKRIEENLIYYGAISGTEPLLTRLIELGGDRQIMHEILRRYSAKAIEQMKDGHENPLIDLLASDTRISKLLRRKEIKALLDVRRYVGIAKAKSERFLQTVVNPALDKYASGN